METNDIVGLFCKTAPINIEIKNTGHGDDDLFDIDLTVLDPVIYSGRYHSLGKMLGEIGDFCKR